MCSVPAICLLCGPVKGRFDVSPQRRVGVLSLIARPFELFTAVTLATETYSPRERLLGNKKPKQRLTYISAHVLLTLGLIP